MPTATEERIRNCLIREGVCEADAAERVAAVIANEIEQGDNQRVREDTFHVYLAQIDASIAQLAREFAERDAERAMAHAAAMTELHELERQRDAKWEERWLALEQRERERDARERERDRLADEREQRYARLLWSAIGIIVACTAAIASVLAVFL